MCAVINKYKKIQTEHKETAPSVLPRAQDLLTDVDVETHALCLALLSQAYVEMTLLPEC